MCEELDSVLGLVVSADARSEFYVTAAYLATAWIAARVAQIMIQ